MVVQMKLVELYKWYIHSDKNYVKYDKIQLRTRQKLVLLCEFSEVNHWSSKKPT